MREMSYCSQCESEIRNPYLLNHIGICLECVRENKEEKERKAKESMRDIPWDFKLGPFSGEE